MHTACAVEELAPSPVQKGMAAEARPPSLPHGTPGRGPRPLPPALHGSHAAADSLYLPNIVGYTADQLERGVRHRGPKSPMHAAGHWAYGPISPQPASSNTSPSHMQGGCVVCVPMQHSDAVSSVPSSPGTPLANTAHPFMLSERCGVEEEWLHGATNARDIQAMQVAAGPFASSGLPTQAIVDHRMMGHKTLLQGGIGEANVHRERGHRLDVATVAAATEVQASELQLRGQEMMLRAQELRLQGRELQLRGEELQLRSEEQRAMQEQQHGQQTPFQTDSMTLRSEEMLLYAQELQAKGRELQLQGQELQCRYEQEDAQNAACSLGAPATGSSLHDAVNVGDGDAHAGAADELLYYGHQAQHEVDEQEEWWREVEAAEKTVEEAIPRAIDEDHVSLFPHYVPLIDGNVELVQCKSFSETAPASALAAALADELAPRAAGALADAHAMLGALRAHVREQERQLEAQRRRLDEQEHILDEQRCMIAEQRGRIGGLEKQLDATLSRLFARNGSPDEGCALGGVLQREAPEAQRVGGNDYEILGEAMARHLNALQVHEHPVSHEKISCPLSPGPTDAHGQSLEKVLYSTRLGLSPTWKASPQPPLPPSQPPLPPAPQPPLQLSPQPPLPPAPQPALPPAPQPALPPAPQPALPPAPQPALPPASQPPLPSASQPPLPPASQPPLPPASQPPLPPAPQPPLPPAPQPPLPPASQPPLPPASQPPLPPASQPPLPPASQPPLPPASQPPLPPVLQACLLPSVQPLLPLSPQPPLPPSPQPPSPLAHHATQLPPCTSPLRPPDRLMQQESQMPSQPELPPPPSQSFDVKHGVHLVPYQLSKPPEPTPSSHVTSQPSSSTPSENAALERGQSPVPHPRPAEVQPALLGDGGFRDEWEPCEMRPWHPPHGTCSPSLSSRSPRSRAPTSPLSRAPRHTPMPPLPPLPETETASTECSPTSAESQEGIDFAKASQTRDTAPIQEADGAPTSGGARTTNGFSGSRAAQPLASSASAYPSDVSLNAEHLHGSADAEAQLSFLSNEKTVQRRPSPLLESPSTPELFVQDPIADFGPSPPVITRELDIRDDVNRIVKPVPPVPTRVLPLHATSAFAAAAPSAGPEHAMWSPAVHVLSSSMPPWMPSHRFSHIVTSENGCAGSNAARPADTRIIGVEPSPLPSHEPICFDPEGGTIPVRSSSNCLPCILPADLEDSVREAPRRLLPMAPCTVQSDVGNVGADETGNKSHPTRASIQDGWSSDVSQSSSLPSMSLEACSTSAPTTSLQVAASFGDGSKTQSRTNVDFDCSGRIASLTSQLSSRGRRDAHEQSDQSDISCNVQPPATSTALRQKARPPPLQLQRSVSSDLMASAISPSTAASHGMASNTMPAVPDVVHASGSDGNGTDGCSGMAERRADPLLAIRQLRMALDQSTEAASARKLDLNDLLRRQTDVTRKMCTHSLGNGAFACRDLSACGNLATTASHGGAVACARSGPACPLSQEAAEARASTTLDRIQMLLAGGRDRSATALIAAPVASTGASQSLSAAVHGDPLARLGRIIERQRALQSKPSLEKSPPPISPRAAWTANLQTSRPASSLASNMSPEAILQAHLSSDALRRVGQLVGKGESIETQPEEVKCDGTDNDPQAHATQPPRLVRRVSFSDPLSPRVKAPSAQPSPNTCFAGASPEAKVSDWAKRVEATLRLNREPTSCETATQSYCVDAAPPRVLGTPSTVAPAPQVPGVLPATPFDRIARNLAHLQSQLAQQ